MNHIYRSIWNSTTQSWVAAPETARSSSGSASTLGTAVKRVFKVSLTAMAAAVAVLTSTGAHALPAGPLIVAPDTTYSINVPSGYTEGLIYGTAMVAADLDVSGELSVYSSGQYTQTGGVANIEFLNVYGGAQVLQGSSLNVTGGLTVETASSFDNDGIANFEELQVIRGTVTNLNEMTIGTLYGTGPMSTGLGSFVNAGTASIDKLQADVSVTNQANAHLSLQGNINVYRFVNDATGVVDIQATESGTGMSADYSITNNGSMRVDTAGYNYTIQGLHGSGTVEKRGAGRLNLSNYIGQGSFLLYQGSLGVAQNQTLGLLAFPSTIDARGDSAFYANGGTHHFNTIVDDGVTLSFISEASPGVSNLVTGTISGSGDLSINGDWQFTGYNLTTGSTFYLKGGNLGLNANALGSSKIVVQEDSTLSALSRLYTNAVEIAQGTLTVNSHNEVWFKNGITGYGGVIIDSPEYVIYDSPTSYTGSTVVKSGTLYVNTGGSLGGSSVEVQSNGNLTLVGQGANVINNLTGMGNVVVSDQALKLGVTKDNVLFDGTLSGDGGLKVVGPKTMNFGSNFVSTIKGDTYLGTSVKVNSSNPFGQGNVQIAGNAKLTIGDYRSVNVAGNITFDPNSVLEVNTDPSTRQAGNLVVAGTANLAGSVNHAGTEISMIEDYKTGVSYKILEAQAITGAFTSATSNYAYLETTLAQTATSVSLNIKRKEATQGNQGTPATFDSLARTPNQVAAASSIDRMDPNSALYQAIQVLPADAPEAVFERISGDTHASLQTSVAQLGSQVGQMGHQHLQDNLVSGFRPGAQIAQSDGPLPASALPSSKALPLWAEVVGNQQTLDGSNNAPGMKQTTTGLFIGGDEEIGTSGWRVGGAVGYTTADAKVKSRDASSNIDSYSMAVFAGKGFSHAGNRVNVTGGLSYAKHNVSTERYVPVLNQSLKADYNAHSTQLFGEVGYSIGQYDKQGFEPFVGITVGQQKVDGFTETGGTAALTADSVSKTYTSTTLGVRAHTDFKLAGKETRLQGSVGVRHAWGSVDQSRTMSFDGGTSFTVAGAPMARNTALIGVQATMELSKYSSLVLGYNGELSSNSRDNTAFAKVRWAF